ncbi:peptidogalycan biosysnthesis protein [Chryseobacterium sp. Ch-15]|uniref:N-acetyltransferase n=1 Tax=Chryseobacterium muglaense TaxID=2893752 RepID=A0A9Q3USJ4_9FLAO|nr:peptidogalycan biosysnthesis protein [Chryseobacterium muglaense]MBD3906374.1 N-acetyltransferase [Chryseobacterium muglaense]MCC9033597.1 peptidogalycan biosysnthesis protein [Chryseobacterium muglaense]MCM2556073.1 peptidogalycan biosysnthesis protein [Chryseobacterium muglaense]
MCYSFKIFNSATELPINWNIVIGQQNIMLSEEYFRVVEESKPINMKYCFVGFFSDENLIGGALYQYLSFIEHKNFQKGEVLCSIRNFLTKQLSKDVMILGNNMLTGQNGFYFDTSKISTETAITLLNEASQNVQAILGKTSLIIYKDYQKPFLKNFEDEKFKSFYRFSVQPNMILNIKTEWKCFDDYSNNLSKKYRARLKSAKKKIDGIQKLELDIESIKKYQNEMSILYQNVAENAPFNTFFLTENHFESMKQNLNDNFKVFAYFLNDKLIGFYTLILNNTDIDTYFLGYDKEIQKEKQIYLNMLFDMTEFGITNQFKRIVFGRTALEIKSTIGAEPVEIFGLIRHNSKAINPFMEKIFTSLNPKVEWIQRKPFK